MLGQVCAAGYYDGSNATTGLVQCETCPSGTACKDKPGVTLRTLPIFPGFYRPSASLLRSTQPSRRRALVTNSTPIASYSTSIDVRRCPDASVNCSNEPVCEHTTSSCLGGSNSEGDALCRKGLGGVLCRTCINFTDDARVYFSGATESEVAQCKPCRDTLPLTVGVGVPAVLAAIALVVVATKYRFKHWFDDKLSDAPKDRLRHNWNAYNPLTKFKILLSFYMMCAAALPFTPCRPAVIM